MPRVSVVVPAHNAAAWLPECLESVAAQTLGDWECAVVDDGSSDGTAELARRFAARDGRFRVISQPRGGVSAARNRGIAETHGEYVAFLDSDDVLPPDKLAWQVAALDADPGAVLVYGETLQFLDGEPRKAWRYLERVRERPCGDAFESLLQLSAIYAPTVRRSALEATGGFDPRLPSAEDWDAWLALARLGRVLHEPRIALRYRLHGSGLSSNVLESYRCARLVADRHLRAVPAARRARVRRGVRRFFRRGYPPRLVAQASRLDWSGSWAAARPLWRAAVALDPRLLLRPRVLANWLWACLPTRREPPWRALRRHLTAPRLESSRASG